ncbi:MAG: glycerol kinase [Blastomonas sp.]
MGEFLLVIDEGTTSTRAMLFDAGGRCHGSVQHEITQYYPAPGLVEHDAGEIWDKSLAAARELVEQAGGADRIAAIGITNQRETVVAWDRRTGEPLGRAIVWQDRRTADMCAALKQAGHEPMVQGRSGLLLDPYFSASKMAWMLEHRPELRAAGDALAFGTVESWLIFRLTGGLHVSDASNASRSMLMALDGKGWDDALTGLFGIDTAWLPEIVDNAGHYGATRQELFGTAIPICGSAGDQQAATIGQACLSPGETKATYGTGAFILTQTGAAIPQSTNRLLATVSHQIDGKRHYALEGSVFVAGSLIKWLRDDIGLLKAAEETEALARSVADSGGVQIVPALSGLGAPHWAPEARASISGLSFATGRAHIARAALEAMAHQSHDLKSAFAGDGQDWTALRIDGGMVANDWMAQDLADILGIEVSRPHFIESTALGAAMLAALGAGLHGSLEEAASAMRGDADLFVPAMAGDVRDARLAGWRSALARVLG